MNIKLLIISVIAVVVVAISLTALVLYRSPSGTGFEQTTPLVGNNTVTTGTNETETKPSFRTKPLTPIQTTNVNVCEIYALRIGAVLRSKIELVEEQYEDYVVQREVIKITGYIRVERVIQDESVALFIKKIVIDNPSELYRKGYDQLADQLLIYFEEPEILRTDYYHSIYIQIEFNPELYENYLKPGTKHVITVTYLYNGVECTKTLEIYMLSG